VSKEFIPSEIFVGNGRDEISDNDFLFLANLLAQHTGIKLERHKTSMLQSRLSRRIRLLELPDLKSYIKHIQKDEEELEHFVNALTTNKTEFFRESDHFKFLSNKYFPALLDSKKNGRLYVWSAACSQGDEVYTLAMLFDEFTSMHPQLDYRILGSDIDTEVLRRAEEGVYRSDAISHISGNYMSRYFEKGTGTNAGKYRITSALKEKVKFRHHNLIENRDLPLKFDVIFLRNVMIYFPTEVIQKVIDKMVRHLNPGGFLFIGHSETLNGIRHPLKPIASALFQKEK